LTSQNEPCECRSEGKKAVPQKAAPKKATPNRAGPKKATLKKATPKKVVPRKATPKKAAANKQLVVRESTKVANLMASEEVRRKFTMTVQVSGREYLADPVAATRRVLILALTKIPAKIHEEQVDNGSNGTVNKRAEIHFNGVLNDPKDPTGADLRSPNLWQWQPADR
jgi:hypothetical protein